ncbi:hypothetical protein KI387_002512, partial [Taxus chinensis]
RMVEKVNRSCKLVLDSYILNEFRKIFDLFVTFFRLRNFTAPYIPFFSVLQDGNDLFSFDDVLFTADLVDTKASKAFIEKEIVKCIDLVKNGVHGVLFVVSVKNRFTPEEAGVLDSLQLLFGANSLNYVVVVFTGGDALEGSGITLEEYLNDCPPQLQ